ncbi:MULTISPECIES: hypothetical protein [unclassified Duganella]|uniref:hypothetical protein n=1 Tax=unclassified Duganella TaxID=2636909 RepID=UPI0006F8ED0B|nr:MULTISPECIES: hypothetical protein [unclassified Duganella]KQV55022.1 hypothetical protein ASD07_28300 [Duganella sp. Root336D2]KRB85003.1 hypothetical protein ASE26_29590 [Duganella sp. Root198D2]
MGDEKINVDVALKKADQLSKEERFQEAIDICCDVIAQEADCYAAYSERSCNLHALGRFEEALRDLGKLIVLRPASPTAYFRRARWQIERGAYELALADLYQVIDFKVEYFNESAYFHLAVALLNVNRIDDALQACGMLSPGFKEFISTPSTPGKALWRDELMLLIQQGKRI